MKHLYYSVCRFSGLLVLVLAPLFFVACRPQPVHYRIGFSQCLDDAWRQTMNSEMQRELLFHPEISLSTRTAYGSNMLQCAQIDSFIQDGVDVLIVSPNEADGVSPAVSRAFRAGIPVIVADRRVDGDEYTAFIGGDNLQVGHILGERLCQIAKMQNRDIHVFEVMGLPGSTPARLRHIGLLESIQNDRHVLFEGSAIANWYEEPALLVMDSVLRSNPRINVVVAQNDLMARGASAAARAQGRDILVLGVDALSGKHGGLQAIVDGTIDASATYFSRGDLVIQRAVQILHGETFVRDTVLQSDLVDKEAAALLLQSSQRIEHEVEAIHMLEDRLLVLSDKYRLQCWLTFAVAVIILALVALALVVIYTIRYRRNVKREHRKQQDLLDHQSNQLSAITEELARIKTAHNEEEKFLQRLRSEIEKRLTDTDLTVEKLSDSIGMSRTSLYRRIKEATNYSPNELIRHIRLERARHLLHTTTLTIQQITYDVGFTSPSYFTRCYRAKYGKSPTDER